MDRTNGGPLRSTATLPLPESVRVSLLVAMRNESSAIRACLLSIAAQRYPSDLLEVLVFDGGSTDDSRVIAGDMVGPRSGWQLRDNPKRIQAAAWNLGIAESSGDVIGIVSGHAELDPDYVAAAVSALRRTGAVMVGGPVRAMGEGSVARAIARGMSTRFGVGGAEFRYLEHEQVVDTVFMGLARRSLWERYSFDESMVRNQDDELSYRLQDAGATIVCSPTIQSTYRSRATFRGLVMQYYDYGFWKVVVLRKHPAQARLRHLAPAALVGAIVGSALLAIVWRPGATIALIVGATYVAANGVASVVASRGQGWRMAAMLPLVFACLHLSYGLGFLVGLARQPRWPIQSLRVLVRSLVGRAVAGAPNEAE